MPFARDAFLDVFAAFNAACWPGALALWLATAAVTSRLLVRRAAPRDLAWLLAAHWGWSGVVYHWGFFTRINPAAWLFGALFVAQAVGLGHWGRSLPLTRLAVPTGARGGLAVGLLAAGLLYPVLIWLSGHAYPRAPMFGVPCPTTLVTAGMLLTVAAVPRPLLVVPMLWCVVGSSAAVLFRMAPDVLLVVALGAFVASGWRPLEPIRRPAAR